MTLVPVLLLGACTSSDRSTSYDQTDRPVVVATSAIVADFVERIAGDVVDLVTIVPNSVDTHTYEPKASELRALDRASLVVLPDADLNPEITQVARLTVGKERLLDLNAAALTADEYFYKDTVSRTGRNVHTWTDPTLAAKWIAPLTQALAGIVPASRSSFEAAAAEFAADLAEFTTMVEFATESLPADARKLVVYHDAWEYFGRRFEYRVVGALQALNFTEPSAAEIAAMADEIRSEGVPVFFGSEVFPSDVMQTLEAESGARYVPDLADDALPGNPGDLEHTYLGMMQRNLTLITESLRP
jgi:ABC-type Zn uptake system ZnuABC Zn-binding protein ZnuA